MPTLQQTEKQTQQTEHNIKLTSAEIANLWSSYQSDSMAICTMGTFLSNVEDKEIGMNWQMTRCEIYGSKK
jgi:hypothetical protein